MENYTTISYNDEERDDLILKNIKNICFSYLNNSNIEDIDDDILYIANDFLIIKFKEIVNLKKNFRIKNYSWPFVEIGKSLDEITLDDDPYIIEELDTDNSPMTKDINYVIDHICFCYGIINKIIDERQIDEDDF